jgi:nitrite reductase/ring-hydroxylating ferredoxin subunit
MLNLTRAIRGQVCRATRTFGSKQRVTNGSSGVIFSSLRKSSVLGSILLGSGAYFGTQKYFSSTVHCEENSLENHQVLSSDDLENGQMKEVVVGDDKDNDVILVARVDGVLYAVSPKCTHYGVNLKYGMLVGDRVYCPAHTASFSVITGYPDGGPVFNGLQTYEVWEDKGKVFVKAPRVIKNHKKDMPMAKQDLTNLERYVIVGGGVAGLSAAESLRQGGFTGEIRMLSGEQWLPYDRTVASKNIMGMDPEGIQLRSREWLTEHGIE